MADPAYRSITPRTLGRNAYIPENDPEFMRRQQEPSSYDLFKQSVIKSAYDEALRATGSEERAMEAANSVSRKMFRTELIGSVVAPEAAMAGAGRAVNVAKGLFGREKAAEAASPLLLSGPRRNAMMPDEMLAADTPSVLRMAPDRPVSLPNSQSLPRLEYDIPTIRSNGLPPARDTMTNPFADELARLAGEGGPTQGSVNRARAASANSLENRALAEADRSGLMRAEGSTAGEEILRLRELAAREEAAFRAQQISGAEGEGMLALKSPYEGRQAAEQALQQARMDRMVDDGGGMAMTRPMERGVSQPGTGFTLGEGSSSGAYRPDFSMPEGSRFGLPALRGSTDVAATGSPAASSSAAPAAGGYDVGAILRKLGLAGMGAGAGAVALDVADDLRRQGPAITGGKPTPDEIAGLVSSSNLGLPAAEPAASLYGLERPNLGLPAAEPAASLYGFQSPASRPTSGQAGGGGSQAQASAPARQEAAAPAVPASVGLWQRYNEAMERGDSSQNALFVMANKAAREEAEGRKSGGSVKEKPQNSSGKDAAMHKALEIIHHMMVNR